MIESKFSKTPACRKAAQFFIAIIFALIIGKVVANIPLFSDTVLFGTLTTAELVKFVTKMTVLVFVFIFTKHATNALQGTGNGVTFLRGIAVPVASLIIIAVAQESVRALLNPFLEPGAGAMLLTVIASLFVLASALWVVFAGYQHAPLLFDFFAAASAVRSRLSGSPAGSVCFNCNFPIDQQVNFCPSCGIDLNTGRCKNCHAQLAPSGKYCGQCGTIREERD